MHWIGAQREASPSRAKTLAVLRRLIAKAGDSGPAADRAARFALGAPGVDAFLGGGLGRACLPA